MKFPFIPVLIIFIGCCCSTHPAEKTQLAITPEVSGPHRFRIVENEMVGYIDSTGLVVIRPVFRSAMEFTEGLAAARINGSYGYIDVSGDFVIQPRFDYAMPFANGYALVYELGRPCFIDHSGAKAFACNYAGAAPFEKGRARVWTDSQKYGCIDPKGTLVIDTAYKSIGPFINGRAAVEGYNHDPSPRDEDKTPVYEVGVIDTLGRFVIPYGRHEHIYDLDSRYTGYDAQEEEESDSVTIGDYIFYSGYGPDSYRELTGIKRKNGTEVIHPCIENYDPRGIHNGLLTCVVDDKLTYLNTAGRTVWQEKRETPAHNTPLNIDYMNRGYFYAYSWEDNGSGGWYVSDNIARKLQVPFVIPGGILSVSVNTREQDTTETGHMGYPVYVINNSKDTILFHAQDSRLYMKVQAMDHQGQWKDIEYLPSSWCGNSYHTLDLPPDYGWKFVTPAYEGDFKTQLRIELSYIDPSKPKEWNKDQSQVFSNEFSGSINPAQFWRKPEYFPGGIMDPYVD